MPNPIQAIAELDPYREAIEALGYSTFEEFAYTAQAANPELSSYLGVPSVDQLIAQVPVGIEAIPRQALDIIAQATYSLGATIDNVPRQMVAPAVSKFAAAPAVNLVKTLPQIRNQEHRGTCVAHAALAAFEQYLNTSGAYQDLSEQFLYWNCKRNDGVPDQAGTWLGVAFPLLHRDGCCLEATWAYNPQPVAGNEGQGPPPGGSQIEALSYRLPGIRTLPPTSVADIKGELARGRCVAFSIPVFNSWYLNKYVSLTGNIVMPVPMEVRSGGHAMCLVGYTDDSAALGLGGGRFILRNSWGQNWGIDSPYGQGYGTIPYAYIARFGTEAYAIA